jgi:hypothetical protein
MRFRVTKKYVREFEIAPRVNAGDEVRFAWYDQKNPGWFFGQTLAGIEGYFPTLWFNIQEESNRAEAQREYDAMELTVEVGQILEVLDTIGRWLLVRAENGSVGWVPKENVVLANDVAV